MVEIRSAPELDMVVPEISVVIPVYRCADCLRPLHAKLADALSALAVDYEIVFVDDRSPDGSWEVLVAIARSDAKVSAFRLSRNFGQAAAITAGVAQSVGRTVVIMDCDLQDRPEDIQTLLAKAAEGYDIVFTRRTSRSQSIARRLGAWAYFRLRNALLNVDMDTQHGSLLLFSRKVADEFLRVRDRDRHHVLILYWLGFRQATVEVTHDERHSGRSSYTLGKLLQSAVEGMFFQTTRLLRWIVYAGLIVGLTGIALAAALISYYFFVHPPPGWTSLAVLLLVVGGFIIVSLGVSSLYVGKIFDQVKDRPLYVIDEQATTASEVQLPHAAVRS